MQRKIIGAIIGGLLGFAYYKLVGCSSGSCPITSNPWALIGYGAFVGLMIGS